MKNRDILLKKIHIGQWCLSPLQSRHLGTSYSSPNSHQLLHHMFLNLTDSLKSLPFQRWFEFWEKPEVAGHQIWAVGGLSHRGALMFCQKTLHETWCMSGHVVWWSCQSPVAHSCGLLNHLNSFHRGMFKFNTKFDADFLLYFLSYFECNSHTVHMLTQWHLLPLLTSTVKSSLFTHAHSSPLSLAASYISVMQTILVLLIMVGIIPERVCIHTNTHVYTYIYTYIYVCIYTHTYIIFAMNSEPTGRE